MERAGRLALDLAAALLHTEASALGELHPCVDNSFCGVPVRGMVCAFCAGVWGVSEGRHCCYYALLIISSDLTAPKEEDGGHSSVKSVTKL